MKELLVALVRLLKTLSRLLASLWTSWLWFCVRWRRKERDARVEPLAPRCRRERPLKMEKGDAR